MTLDMVIKILIKQDCLPWLVKFTFDRNKYIEEYD